MSETIKQTVVVVDPDPDFLKWVSRHLHAPSIEIETFEKSDEALKCFFDKKADLLLTELHLSPFDGLELLKKVRQNQPNAMVLMSGTVNSTNAVIEAMQLGAFDFLRKESLNFELRTAVEKALQAAEQIKLAAEESASDAAGREKSSDLIIGRSPAMQDVFKLIGRVARADAPVLITGESGVGKEVVANAIHKFSRRASAEYVAINCAAIPANLLESELFGHEKGAFTGAVAQRVGRFEQCDKGTLFLDEVGEIPLEVQSKLLRVLQSGEFSRVGGNQALHSDVRILAATNKHLEAEVEEGNFREDLFYRLNVVRIHIPPLRRRREDIRLLAEHFLDRQSRQGAARRMMQFSEESIDSLENHDWPGNVRELENAIERACVLATGNVLLPRDLPLSDAPRVNGARKPSSGGEKKGTIKLGDAAKAILAAADTDENFSPLEIAERELLWRVLSEEKGEEAAAAKRLGFTKAAFGKKVAKFGDSPKESA